MAEQPTDTHERDDELLSSLVDGELPERERIALEARLAAEPALAQRLEAMRRADRALRDSYGPVADEPLPAALLALLGRDSARGDSAAVVPLRRTVPPRFWMPASIAAGIALAIGFALGVSLELRDPTDTELLLASSVRVTPDYELFGVLESTASGETVSLAGDLAATPRLTFRTFDGAYCRELALSTGPRRSAVVSCREDDAWRIAAVIEVPASGLDNDGSEFAPASGPVSELDSVVNAMMAGAPLDAEAERRAMAAGWR